MSMPMPVSMPMQQGQCNAKVRANTPIQLKYNANTFANTKAKMSVPMHNFTASLFRSLETCSGKSS
jgi:hypothetical protein